MFKRPEGKYTPRRYQPSITHKVFQNFGSDHKIGKTSWLANQLRRELRRFPDTCLQEQVHFWILHKLVKLQPEVDWRNNGTSYLSAALRTPKFWEQRFENIGKHVRDSNPISLESINRWVQVFSSFFIDNWYDYNILSVCPCWHYKNKIRLVQFSENIRINILRSSIKIISAFRNICFCE